MHTRPMIINCNAHFNEATIKAGWPFPSVSID